MKSENESSSTLRIGKVTEFDAEKLRARVNFPELGIISHWLPLLVMNTLKTKDTYYLDEGEHVACIMRGTGTEAGYILGAIYDDKNTPEIQDRGKRTVKFDDDTLIEYDRKEHKLTIDCSGDIEIKAKGHIGLTAGRIDFN